MLWPIEAHVDAIDIGDGEFAVDRVAGVSVELPPPDAVDDAIAGDDEVREAFEADCRRDS